MPIIENIDPIVEQPEITPEIQHLEYRDATVDKRYQPIGGALSHIDGYRQTVDFYRQILGADSQPMEYDPEKSSALQSYHEIKGLLLPVQSPLTPTGNGDSIQGEAIVFPFIVPNALDFFIADKGDGEAGMFQIIQVTPMTIYRETCHLITYTLVGDVDQTIRQNIASKVGLATTFRKDFMLYGQNPVIVDSQLVRYTGLEDAVHNLTTQFLGQSINYDLQTLIVPCDQGIVYDPFYVSTVKRCVDISENFALRKIRVFDCQGNESDDRLTLWDMMLHRDIAMLPLIVPKMTLIPRRLYLGGQVLNGIAFTEVDYAIYPAELTLLSNDISTYGVTLSSSDVIGETNSRAEALKLLAGLDAADEQTALVHPVDLDVYYVFSEAFYLGDTTGMSAVEREVFKMIKQEAVDEELIITAYKSLPFWRPLERYYYTLVLILLARYAMTQY